MFDVLPSLFHTDILYIVSSFLGVVCGQMLSINQSINESIKHIC